MTDDGQPWMHLPVRPDAYKPQERLNLTLRGIPPTCQWDDPRADHPLGCRCPRHLATPPPAPPKDQQ